MIRKTSIRLGGASGFWGDSAVGPAQLVQRGDIDYLVFDYLAETTMAILAAVKAKKPDLGYATDFVEVMRDLLPEIAHQHIRVVSNAGGLNPQACANALTTVAAELGLSLNIAVVLGDDIRSTFHTLPTEAFEGQGDANVAVEWLSANAYFGALPIAQALSAGADVVITGRCVDSAVTLGPLINEFGWAADDYDRLAAGSLAGHIIECGCQATGGLFTDWSSVPDWANMGYPIVECKPSGEFFVTKPPATGGLIAAAAVSEQLVYEIGDPAQYILPDVICDFSDVRIAQDGAGRVRVTGARGSRPTRHYKVSATYRDGFRCSGTMVIVGIDAPAKARRTAEAVVARSREIIRNAGFADFTGENIEVIGAESLYGPHARALDIREVMLRVTVTHSDAAALERFAREVAPSGTSWSPGTTMPQGGRPVVMPVIRQFNCLVPKRLVQPSAVVSGNPLSVDIPPGAEISPSIPVAPFAGVRSRRIDGVPVALIRLAYARSGDKGERSNIGVIARLPEFLPLIEQQLTADEVHAYFGYLGTRSVRRYALPGISAFNFVLEGALPGGGSASLRMDPMGKGMAQMLLDFEMRVPAELLELLTAPPTEPQRSEEM